MACLATYQQGYGLDSNKWNYLDLEKFTDTTTVVSILHFTGARDRRARFIEHPSGSQDLRQIQTSLQEVP